MISKTILLCGLDGRLILLGGVVNVLGGMFSVVQEGKMFMEFVD